MNTIVERAINSSVFFWLSKIKSTHQSLEILQEEILKYMDENMDGVRSKFPRLFFLSNEDMVQLLSISRNPSALTPFVRKCFSGISDLAFSLPSEAAKSTSLDFALNGKCLYAKQFIVDPFLIKLS